MAKIDLEKLEVLLVRNEVAHEQLLKIMNEAQGIIQEEKARREQNVGPKEKFTYAIFVSDPQNKVDRSLELVGWVVKARAGVKTSELPARLLKVASGYNNSPTGTKNPVKTVGELFQWVARRFWKPEEIFHTTKEPVQVFFTTNRV